METNNKNSKSGILAAGAAVAAGGIGTVAGAAVGVGGAVLANKAMAANEPEKIDELPVEEDTEVVAAETETSEPEHATQSTQHVYVHHVTETEPVHTPTPEPEPEPEPIIEPEPNPTTPSTSEEGLHVVGYREVDLGDGETADVLDITMDGHEGMIVDVDSDGLADAIGVDMNDDGYYADDEVVDISDESIAMVDIVTDYYDPNASSTQDYVQEQVVDDTPVYETNDDLIADNGTPDYINDGNVDDFMA